MQGLWNDVSDLQKQNSLARSPDVNSLLKDSYVDHTRPFMISCFSRQDQYLLIISQAAQCIEDSARWNDVLLLLLCLLTTAPDSWIPSPVNFSKQFSHALLPLPGILCPALLSLRKSYSSLKNDFKLHLSGVTLIETSLGFLSMLEVDWKTEPRYFLVPHTNSRNLFPYLLWSVECGGNDTMWVLQSSPHGALKCNLFLRLKCWHETTK